MKALDWTLTRAARSRFRGRLAAEGALPRRFLQGVEVEEGALLTVGANLALSAGTRLAVRKGARMSIGADVVFNHYCLVVCREQISIGDGVLFGPHVCIFDHDHDFRSDDRRSTFVSGPVSIGDDVWLSAGVVVTRGVSIGAGCVVGANAVVTCDLPPRTVAAGAPARVIAEL